MFVGRSGLLIVASKFSDLLLKGAGCPVGYLVGIGEGAGVVKLTSACR